MLLKEFIQVGNEQHIILKFPVCLMGLPNYYFSTLFWVYVCIYVCEYMYESHVCSGILSG